MGIKIVLQGCVHKLVSYQSVVAGVGIILGALPIRDTGSDLCSYRHDIDNNLLYS